MSWGLRPQALCCRPLRGLSTPQPFQRRGHLSSTSERPLSRTQHFRAGTVMKKTKLPLILLLSVSFLPFSLYAQSGRKTTPEPKPGKTEPAKTPETNEEVRESSISPDGETVEGDVIRFDTSLVTVPV